MRKYNKKYMNAGMQMGCIVMIDFSKIYEGCCKIINYWITLKVPPLIFVYKSLTRLQLMGKKGKYRQIEEEPVPKKKAVLTEEQLMDKSHMDKTEYIPLLPSQAMYPPFIFNSFSEAALQKIVSDLNYLLYVDFKTFWATVLYNPTLRHCLSSCISYLHRRWLNSYVYSKQSEQEFEQDQKNRQHYKIVKDENSYEFTQGLMQVILVIYHRVVSFNLENKQLSALYKIGEEINRKFILDIPRLLQLCEIYGSNNNEIIRYIVKMYANTDPQFYKTMRDVILQILFKKIEDTLRSIKTQTDRQEYGINYSYKRLVGQQLSQGEQQLKKKTSYLMTFISFTNIINSIIQYFPQECVDHCYYNSQVQLLFENIFLELQIAYKTWDYQTQEIKMLGMINFVIKKCIDYFVSYFERCNVYIVAQTKKTSTLEAYVLSLERIFKDFGKRMTISKKNASKNLLMYKIVQKEFDLHSMLHSIYANETEDPEFGFNLEYLKQIIIAFDTQFQEEYINEEEPRQHQIQEQTQAEPMNEEDIDENQEVKQLPESKKAQEQVEKTKEEKDDLEQLELLIPKRMRSQDYYTKLYADFNKKFYKGEYDDDYDEIADYDKRPLANYQESSSSESDHQDEARLITNDNYLNHIRQIHTQRFAVNREEVRLKNANQPKFGRVEKQEKGGPKRYEPKGEKSKEEGAKKKYVEKTSEGRREGGREDEEVPNDTMEGERVQYREREGDTPEKRGGQGFKKSNKSYAYKPKERHDNFDKGRNSNKNKEFKERKYK